MKRTLAPRSAWNINMLGVMAELQRIRDAMAQAGALPVPLPESPDVTTKSP